MQPSRGETLRCIRSTGKGSWAGSLRNCNSRRARHGCIHRLPPFRVGAELTPSEAFNMLACRRSRLGAGLMPSWTFWFSTQASRPASTLKRSSCLNAFCSLMLVPSFTRWDCFVASSAPLPSPAARTLVVRSRCCPDPRPSVSSSCNPWRR